ncbi:flavoprotein [Enemella evansiae]|uniref:flavoprotein n=1 Tax=Enemella evansiae TaxID=2016499 RepID=UPI000B9763B0|nr:flavoprotein [Enemella evansiae]OYO09380.1 flavoprotein [Enemella evansiae]
MSHIAVVASGAGGVEELREQLIKPLIELGHSAAVTLTPTAGHWLESTGEVAALEQATGYPVRWKSRLPSDPRPHPQPDVIVAAPWSANSTAKLALGIADNQALTFICESMTLAPTIVFPRINAAHARQPAWTSHIEALRSAGLHLIEGRDLWPLHEPRQGRNPLPWPQIVALANGLASTDESTSK